MTFVYYKTPVGIAKITEEDGFITRIHIMDEEPEIELTTSPLLNEAMKQLDEYFAGSRKIFDFPIKQEGSDFQQQVWQELLKIDYGKTISYGQQSQQMNSPLPCHRVIGSNGSLTGYAGGLWRKQWLLEHEAKVLGVGQTKLEF
jgi:methylated-DNA-[protein]-cysteine S-methyltransferase